MASPVMAHATPGRCRSGQSRIISDKPAIVARRSNARIERVSLNPPPLCLSESAATLLAHARRWMTHIAYNNNRSTPDSGHANPLDARFISIAFTLRDRAWKAKGCWRMLTRRSNPELISRRCADSAVVSAEFAYLA